MDILLPLIITSKHHSQEVRDFAPRAVGGRGDQSGIPLVFTAVSRELPDVWLADSGCSFHITAHLDWLQKYKPLTKLEDIWIGDGGNIGAVVASQLFSTLRNEGRRRGKGVV